jgi:hypothetical protein
MSVVGCHGTTGDVVIGWLDVGGGMDDSLSGAVADSCSSLVGRWGMSVDLFFGKRSREKHEM